MINEQAFICAPVPFFNICLIFPPKVKEVVTNPDFPKYRQILTMSQEDVEDQIVEQEKKTGQKLKHIPTPIEYLMESAKTSKEFLSLLEKSFFFFTHQKVTINTEKQIIIFGDITKLITTINSIENLPIINEGNFFVFQNEVRKSLGLKTVEPPNPNEHPKVKQMKAKARYRDRIKAKNGNGVSLGTSLSSICCMGLGLTPLNIGEMSFAAVDYLIHTYQEKERYETDIRTLQAGGDSKKIKPKYWIRNLED